VIHPCALNADLPIEIAVSSKAKYQLDAKSQRIVSIGKDDIMTA
jgi:hypothetical protein